MPDDPVANPYTKNDPLDGGHAEGMSIADCVKTSQMVTFAMAMGLLFVSGVMVFVAAGDAEFADLLAFNKDKQLLLGIGCVCTLIGVVASFVLRSLVRKQSMHSWLETNPQVDLPISVDVPIPQAHKLLEGVTASNLIGAALLEGPGVINAILMMVNQYALHLIPIAICFVCLLVKIPTINGVKNYIETAISENR